MVVGTALCLRKISVDISCCYTFHYTYRHENNVTTVNIYIYIYTHTQNSTTNNKVRLSNVQKEKLHQPIVPFYFFYIHANI